MAYDDELASELFEFYQGLLTAERLRRLDHKNVAVVPHINEGIHSALAKVASKFSNVKTLLKEEIGTQ